MRNSRVIDTEKVPAKTSPGNNTSGDGRISEGSVTIIRASRIKRMQSHEGTAVKANTYLVVENGTEFLITYASHPHHGASLYLEGYDGTLHIRTEDNRVVRQIVALGGGCALAISEEVVDGLSPASLRGVITAEQTGEAGDITIGFDD